MAGENDEVLRFKSIVKKKAKQFKSTLGDLNDMEDLEQHLWLKLLEKKPYKKVSEADQKKITHLFCTQELIKMIEASRAKKRCAVLSEFDERNHPIYQDKVTTEIFKLIEVWLADKSEKTKQIINYIRYQLGVERKKFNTSVYRDRDELFTYLKKQGVSF